MSQALTRSIAKAVIIVSLGGIVVGNLAVNFVPSKKPPYAVMAKQRAEKEALLSTNNSNQNDTDSRANSN